MIGQMEAKLQGQRGTPLRPANGQSASGEHTRTVEEGQQFVAEHSQLLSELEELKHENEHLRNAAGASGRQALVCRSA